MRIDWDGIHDRVASLLSAEDRGGLAMQLMLARAADQREPRLTASSAALLARILGEAVRLYGLDPCWVLTGQCDPAMHRLALESTPHELQRLMFDILETGTASPAPARERPESQPEQRAP